jgi:heme oxygenase
MNVIIVSHSVVICCPDQSDMILQGKFMDFVSLCEKFQRTLEKALNVINLIQMFFEVVSFQNLSQKNWIELLKVKREFVETLEKVVQNQSSWFP